MHVTLVCTGRSGFSWLGLWLLALFLVNPRYEAECAERIIRGDVDGRGSVNISDAVHILNYLFVPVFSWEPWCLDAADIDDSGQVNVSDVVGLLQFLFHTGPPPAPPFPSCGEDPNEDELECRHFGPCAARDGQLEFYGRSFAVDTAVFVLDRSEAVYDTLEEQKAEVLRAIFRSRDLWRFAILAFDRGLDSLPDAQKDRFPVGTGGDNLTVARSFLNDLKLGGGNCPREALILALEFATNEIEGRAGVFLVSQGMAQCHGVREASYIESTLDVVSLLNVRGISIHCFGVSSPRARDEAFLRDLAARAGGTYMRVGE